MKYPKYICHSVCGHKLYGKVVHTNGSFPGDSEFPLAVQFVHILGKQFVSWPHSSVEEISKEEYLASFVIEE